MSSLPIDYRPTDFNQFIGSEASVKILKSKMKKDHPPHSYLIHGPSGCGKTTLGRIAAGWLINTDDIENNMNFTELDAVSFGLKDTIRDIRKKMKMAPVGGHKARVWLLDECHKLTPDAQEAMLKALEDTPAHVYFILATTEPGKLKITLKRRCVPIEVFPVDEEEMTTFLNQIVELEEKEIPSEIIELIIDRSIGSPGIALQQLEMIIDVEPEDMEDVIQEYEDIQTKSIDLCQALIRKEKWKSIIKILNNGLLDGSNIESIRIGVLRYAVAVLRKKDDTNAYLIADAFKMPFYNDSKERLVVACYEAIFE